MTETPEKFLATKIQHTLKRLITLRTCRLFLFKQVIPFGFIKYIYFFARPCLPCQLSQKESKLFFSSYVQFLLLLLFFLKLKS